MNTNGMPRLSQVEMRGGVRDGLQDLVEVVQPEDEAVVGPLVPRHAPAPAPSRDTLAKSIIFMVTPGASCLNFWEWRGEVKLRFKFWIQCSMNLLGEFW